MQTLFNERDNNITQQKNKNEIFDMKKRTVNIIFNKDGHNNMGHKINLPTKWIKEMNLIISSLLLSYL